MSWLERCPALSGISPLQVAPSYLMFQPQCCIKPYLRAVLFDLFLGQTLGKKKELERIFDIKYLVCFEAK